jgi:hypothetical protein
VNADPVVSPFKEIMMRSRLRLPKWLADELTIENAIGVVSGLIVVAVIVLDFLGYAK